MITKVISVENLSKVYRLGQIGTGTFTNDMKVWLARARGKPSPLLKIGQENHGNRAGEEIWALKDVSFSVEQGEVLGIIGKNGAGKSTLLKILSRVTAPTSGKIKVKGRIASLLEVGTGFHPELTGRENVYLNGAILGMTRAEVDRKFDEIVAFAEVEKFIDTPVKRYSSGMYVRLAFAVAAHLEPEILVVDEVLAVGDAEFQKKCLGKMGEVAKEGRTVLFVSHQLDSILTLCPNTCVLRLGEIMYRGTSDTAVSMYLNEISSYQNNDNSHILFTSTEIDNIFVERIEVFNTDRTPKPMIFTWDNIILRVYYYSNLEIRAGSYVIDIRDSKQQRLIVLDSGLKLPIERGHNKVDCFIQQLPLSAGDYYLGIGLARSNSGWLWRNTNLAYFKVHGKDVFKIGRPPITERMLFAINHEWHTADD